MKDDYRWLAPFYEKIAQLVFGQELNLAHFDLMENGQWVLGQAKIIVWLGGGTGIGINELLETAPHAHLIYVEPSNRMRKLAQAKVKKNFRERIEWVKDNHLWLYQPNQSLRWAEQKIDLLITAFMLDVLRSESLIELIKWSNEWVDTWFYADFVPQERWHKKGFIQFMYICFMLCTGIRQRSLIDHQSLMSDEGWCMLPQSRRTRAKQLVVSALYSRES